MTPTLSDGELVFRLLTAVLLGGVVGLEREWRNKEAGLRTNILIALGSAAFTLMSIELTDGRTGDTSRVAPALRRLSKSTLTAATIWVNAAIGVAAGGGEFHLAVIMTAITLLVLLVLQPIEKYIDHRRRPGTPVKSDKKATDA